MQYFPLYYKALPQLPLLTFTLQMQSQREKQRKFNLISLPLRTKVTNPINALSTNWPFDLNIHINYENPKMQKFKKKKIFDHLTKAP